MNRLRVCLFAIAMTICVPTLSQAIEGPAWKAPITWVVDRAKDFLDIFDANVSAGWGPGADIRLTRLAEIGYSDYDVTRIGLNGRKAPVWEDSRDEANITLAGATLGETSYDPYDVGVTLNAMLAGAELGFNVRSLADFFTSMVLWDIEDDDALTN